MIEVKAPNKYPKNKLTIFTAGVIDESRSEDWQNIVVKSLHDYDVLILNPRRDSWDDSWKQEIENEKFREQVEWELDGMEEADILLIVFASNEKEAKESKAPISLLELGLHVKNKPMICCPNGFYRKGNVDIVAARYGLKVYENLNDLLAKLKKRLDTVDLYEKWNKTNTGYNEK